MPDQRRDFQFFSSLGNLAFRSIIMFDIVVVFSARLKILILRCYVLFQCFCFVGQTNFWSIGVVAVVITTLWLGGLGQTKFFGTLPLYCFFLFLL